MVIKLTLKLAQWCMKKSSSGLICSICKLRYHHHHRRANLILPSHLLLWPVLSIDYHHVLIMMNSIETNYNLYNSPPPLKLLNLINTGMYSKISYNYWKSPRDSAQTRSTQNRTSDYSILERTLKTEYDLKYLRTKIEEVE